MLSDQERTTSPQHDEQEVIFTRPASESQVLFDTRSSMQDTHNELHLNESNVNEDDLIER